MVEYFFFAGFDHRCDDAMFFKVHEVGEAICAFFFGIKDAVDGELRKFFWCDLVDISSDGGIEDFVDAIKVW